MNLYDEAKRVVGVGISIVPVGKDKLPVTQLLPDGKWKQFQFAPPEESHLNHWFADHAPFGFATIGGAVSRNLEILDFDVHGGVCFFDGWKARVRSVAPKLVERLVVNCTPSGGWHVRYRCREIEVQGNTKLAKLDAKQTMIETRGEGGYALCPPCDGYLWFAGSLLKIPDITADERQILIDAARSFNQLPEAKGYEPKSVLPEGGRPGDTYNASDDFKQVLAKYGWECVVGGDRELWKRPGTKNRWSATFNATHPKMSERRFYVFTDNADPFEAERSYSPFAVFSLLECGGDFGLAARKLSELGYGESKGVRQGKSIARGKTIEPEQTVSEKQPTENGLEIRYSDGWRAKRLVSLFGDNLRYCDEWGKWLVWDGKRFTIDRQLEILSYAKRTTADMLREAARVLEMGGDADTLIAEAKKSDSNAKYNAMISLARSEPNVPILAESVNRDQMLLNVANGTVDLTHGKLLPFDRSNLITKLAPVTFDPDADCPLWTESLGLFMDGRESLINFLQRAVGYAITGQISEQVLIILYGTGANGKSTFIETVLALLGEYAGQTEPDLLIMKRNENHPSGLADLMGRRFVATTEIGEGVRLNEPLVKRLTGGDRIKARFMREDWFEFAPTHKIFAAVNHEPTIRGTDNGIWRRIRLVPFDVTIPEAKQVPFNTMLERLKGEMSGILNWAIEGCRMWQGDGLGLPSEIKKATDRYRLDMDVVGRFLDECCYVNAEMKAKAGDLYKAFCEWCEQCGEKTFSQKVFGGKLAEKGFTSVKGTGGYKFWDGLGISNHSADENDRDFM